MSNDDAFVGAVLDWLEEHVDDPSVSWDRAGNDFEATLPGGRVTLAYKPASGGVRDYYEVHVYDAAERVVAVGWRYLKDAAALVDAAEVVHTRQSLPGRRAILGALGIGD